MPPIEGAAESEFSATDSVTGRPVLTEGTAEMKYSASAFVNETTVEPRRRPPATNLHRPLHHLHRPRTKGRPVWSLGACHRPVMLYIQRKFFK